MVNKKIEQPKYKVLIEFPIEKCKLLEKRDNSKKFESRKQFKHDENRDKYRSPKSININEYSVSNVALKSRKSLSILQGRTLYIFLHIRTALLVTSRLAEIKELDQLLKKQLPLKKCNSRGCKKCSIKHNI